MTCTTPCRRITLHFSHIGLTDALTFMTSSLAHCKQKLRAPTIDKLICSIGTFYLNRYVILPRCRS
jgi:hypothetical protein